MAERKKQNLLTGAGALAIATVLVKVIGALYKIPLTNLITMEGYAYFQGAYAVYTPLYAISMAGLPVAVSKLVSQNIELGRIKDAKRIFTVARRLFLAVGLVGTLLLAVIAVPYSRMVKSPDNYIGILAIAPCILFCCQMSSFRGYYEGLKNMTPTGVSQVIEAVVKLSFGLAATYVCFNYWLNDYRKNAVDGFYHFFGRDVRNEAEALAAMYPYAAAVAVLGVTLGSFLGLVFLFIHYKKHGFGFTREELVNSPPAKNDKTLRNQLIRIAAPVALSSIILNISNIIDDATIRARLAYAVENGADVIKQMYASSFAAAQTLDTGIKDYLYGAHGSVLNVKNLIPTITMTLGISAIPALSAAWTARNKREVRVTIESALRISMMVALPAGFGMAALSEPILKLLYSSQQHMAPVGAPLLTVYGFGVFLFAAASPITNMLQAVGRTDIPLKSVAIGSALKIFLNFILIGRPEINIHGAPISTTICYIVMVAINLTSLLKITKAKINFFSVFVKPLVSAAACGATAWSAYFILVNKIGLSSKLSTLVSICLGAGIYAVILVLIKGISKDDLEMIPKGEKIAKVLAKFGLLG